jgi:hypothetical protein
MVIFHSYVSLPDGIFHYAIGNKHWTLRMVTHISCTDNPAPSSNGTSPKKTAGKRTCLWKTI